MKIMDSEKKELIKEAAKRLKGHEKRAYIAKISLDYFQGNARHTEREMGWGRECVQKGLKEKETGIRCIDGYYGLTWRLVAALVNLRCSPI